MRRGMKLFVVLFCLTGALYGAMLVLTVPVLMDEAGGLKPFDFRPMGYGYEDVVAYLDALSEEGLAMYLGLQHQLDAIYPAVLAAMFISGFLSFLGPFLSRAMSVVAVIGALADYGENLLVTRMLTQPLSEDTVATASLLSTIKAGATTLCWCALIFIAVRSVVRRVRPSHG